MLQKAFLDYLLLEKKYSKLTVNAYKKDIESFTSFLKDEDQTNTIKEVSYSQIRSWIVFLVEKQLSNRSINRKISALNSFFKFLLKINEVKVNPLSKHKALKTSKKIQVPFSEQEINTVLDEIGGESDFESIRNKLIIEMFYSTGIRRIYKGLYVSGFSEPLFRTNRGVKIYENFVFRLVNSYFSKVTVKNNVSPHILRHSFATHFISNGADLNAVKELLGHSSLAATQVYTNNSIAQLKEVYKKAHPRNKNN